MKVSATSKKGNEIKIHNEQCKLNFISLESEWIYLSYKKSGPQYFQTFA